MTTKTRSITYWTTTILVAFFIGGGGVAQVFQYLGNPHGVVPQLDYPMYFFSHPRHLESARGYRHPGAAFFRGLRSGRTPASSST